MDPVDYILHLLDTRGFQDYLGEPISQREHALQTADLARREHASPSLVAAALLHDIGHLLPADQEPSHGGDALHEERQLPGCQRTSGRRSPSPSGCTYRQNAISVRSNPNISACSQPPPCRAWNCRAASFQRSK